MQIVFKTWLDNYKSVTSSSFCGLCMTLKSNLGYTLLYSVSVTGLQQVLLAILQFTWTVLLFCGVIPRKIQDVVA